VELVGKLDVLVMLK